MRTATIPAHQSARRAALAALLLVTAALWMQAANAIPVFARQYEMSCAACHAAYPRLNAFGEQFRDNNIRLPNWREKTAIDTKDDMLALPKFPPMAIRAQAYAQYRQAREVDTDPASPTYYSGFTDNNAESDIQAPYLIKLLSARRSRITSPITATASSPRRVTTAPP